MKEIDRHQFGDGQSGADGRPASGLTAIVAAHGAELQSIRTPAGRELLWQAGPQWPKHAPNLFPIVGRLAGDRLIHQGVAYRMTQHGFARDRAFTFVARDANSCRLLLRSDRESLAVYPFPFSLELHYRIAGGTLGVRMTVSNPGDEILPASFGAHPAFTWPLDPGVPAEAHEIVFEHDEPAPIRRVSGGLLRPDAAPTPVQGRRLRLDPSLFDDDAVILATLHSRSLRYGIPGRNEALRIGWDGFAQLGLWSKRGAPFLCIEPWSGLASPQGFEGEFVTKPHLMLIPPGESRHAEWTLTPLGMA